MWHGVIGKMVREFRNSHTSHIFDVKFDVGRIVRCGFSFVYLLVIFSDSITPALTELFI